ncbi:hypothetical protein RRG08_008196 [Elysia crispata]|uniref:Uncharacterized protein n=1 Tax=Elysia crispata TaxID=231223 RepID=A0AAE1CZV4_9GAST|nr:hypothetical protein RRG08_008196 [Elysia crispata]
MATQVKQTAIRARYPRAGRQLLDLVEPSDSKCGSQRNLETNSLVTANQHGKEEGDNALGKDGKLKNIKLKIKRSFFLNSKEDHYCSSP